MLLFLSKLFPSLAAIQHFSIRCFLPHPTLVQFPGNRVGAGRGKVGIPTASLLCSGQQGVWGWGREMESALEGEAQRLPSPWQGLITALP